MARRRRRHGRRADRGRGRADHAREPGRGRRCAPARRHAPRPRQRALARVPARAARPHPARRRQLLDLARGHVRARGDDDARPLLRAGARHLRGDAAGRHHVRRRVRLPALQRRADRGRERDRHPAHAARRLLSRGRVRRGAPTMRSGGSATATPRVGPSASRRSRARRSVPRSTRCARSRRTRSRPSSSGRRASRCTSTSPSSGPRTRRASQTHGCTPTELLAELGALGPDSTAVHATHLTEHDEQLCTRRRSACARRPSATSPTASAAPGPNLSLGSDSHAVIDLFEEARAVELDLRLATEQRGHFTAPPCCAARPTTRASAGPTPAGSSPARSPTSSRSASTRRALETAEPETMLESVVFAATAADVTGVIVGGKPC